MSKAPRYLLGAVLCLIGLTGCRDREHSGKGSGEPQNQDAELTAMLLNSPSGRRLGLAGAVLESEGERLYDTAAVARAGAAIANLSPNMREVAVIRELTVALALLGCADSAQAASAGRVENAGAVLAAGCPKTGPVVSQAQARGAPLWAVALAIVLEVQARVAERETEPLHRALVATLLAQRIERADDLPPSRVH